MFGPTVKHWDFNTCGLTTVCGWSRGYSEGDWKTWLLQSCDARWSSTKNGNILYVITSQQLHQPSLALKAALDWPHTRIVHAYKQNAHGPNWILVCFTHLYPETNDLKDFTNNVEEYRQRLKLNTKTGWYELHDFNQSKKQTQAKQVVRVATKPKPPQPEPDHGYD